MYHIIHLLHIVCIIYNIYIYIMHIYIYTYIYISWYYVIVCYNKKSIIWMTIVTFPLRSSSSCSSSALCCSNARWRHTCHGRTRGCAVAHAGPKRRLKSISTRPDVACSDMPGDGFPLFLDVTNHREFHQSCEDVGKNLETRCEGKIHLFGNEVTIPKYPYWIMKHHEATWSRPVHKSFL